MRRIIILPNSVRFLIENTLTKLTKISKRFLDSHSNINFEKKDEPPETTKVVACEGLGVQSIYPMTTNKKSLQKSLILTQKIINQRRERDSNSVAILEETKNDLSVYRVYLMLNNNNLIKIGLLTALIAFGVIGVFAIGGVTVSSLVYGQQQSTRHFSLIHDTFSLGFREFHSDKFYIDPAAENVVLSGQYNE